MISNTPFEGLPVVETHYPPLYSDPSSELHETLTASAVMLIVHKVNNHWHILFTRRAKHLNHHPGQISFPGGRYDESDTHLLNTAIRETQEEIGVAAEHLSIVGHLPDRATLTGFRIYPFIAMVDSLPTLTISQNEVSEVFSAPLDFVCDVQNQFTESVYYQGKLREYYKIHYQNQLIWGATARMLVDLTSYYTN